MTKNDIDGCAPYEPIAGLCMSRTDPEENVMADGAVRREHDLIGEADVPAGA